MHHSTIANIQTLPELAPDALLPPPPNDNPQPPEFAAQDFLLAKKAGEKTVQESQNFGYRQEDQSRNEKNGELENTRDYTSRQGGHYKNTKQQIEKQNIDQQSTPGYQDSQNEGEEEVRNFFQSISFFIQIF